MFCSKQQRRRASQEVSVSIAQAIQKLAGYTKTQDSFSKRTQRFGNFFSFFLFPQNFIPQKMQLLLPTQRTLLEFRAYCFLSKIQEIICLRFFQNKKRKKTYTVGCSFISIIIQKITLCRLVKKNLCWIITALRVVSCKHWFLSDQTLKAAVFALSSRHCFVFVGKYLSGWYMNSVGCFALLMFWAIPGLSVGL